MPEKLPSSLFYPPFPRIFFLSFHLTFSSSGAPIALIGAVGEKFVDRLRLLRCSSGIRPRTSEPEKDAQKPRNPDQGETRLSSYLLPSFPLLKQTTQRKTSLHNSAFLNNSSPFWSESMGKGSLPQLPSVSGARTHTRPPCVSNFLPRSTGRKKTKKKQKS